jgi:periplasmic protein TonB
MPLRCLLFSSDEEMVQPIWQVLTDLGIEGEYCRNAVDAVERVTTQLFQIVITDWEDQPEAGFLLKTARDLKAAHRPLTLAIVSDGARTPEALQAGANSVLMKPIRIEQVRDTMSTACELLRSKERPAGERRAEERPAAPASVPLLPPIPGLPREAADTIAMAASASASAAPASVGQVFEKSFRAGEFLQSAGSAPGAQFDTESEVQKELDQAAASEVDALTDLEPTAAAVQDSVAEQTGAEPTEAAETQEPLTGWAALQARLTKRAPAPPAEDASPGNEMLSYGDTTSYAAPAPNPIAEQNKEPVKKESRQDAESEAALFAYISGQPKESSQPEEEPHIKSGKSGRLLVAGVLALAGIVLVAVPRARQNSRLFYRNAVRAGKSWLNPAPAPLPQAVVQHDSFGAAGDEYNLPAAGNIPNATTDPSQIRVVPVIDPTAKPDKNADANGAQAQSPAASTDQSQTNQAQTVENPSVPALAGTSPEAAPPASSAQSQQSQSTPPAAQPTPPSHPAPTPAQNPAPAQSVSPGASSTGIPSSLKSQIAPSTPESSGTMPAEAAMSSIEPVSLPETAARGLLAQPVDPVYPDAAKAGGLRGSVVLQVLIGRDGAVQDAKFLQGSLVFARAAIDAVKQWRFKPYSMNGRTVSVQTVISLSFAPPA